MKISIQSLRRRNFFSHFIAVLALLFQMLNAQQDIALKISEAQLNEALATLIDARGVNFGDYTGSIIADAWFVNLDGCTVTVQPGNAITLNVNIAATAVDVFGVINNITVHPSFGITGIVRLDQSDDGYKVMFDPQGISNFYPTGEDFIDDLIQSYTNDFIAKIPEIELNSGSKLLPSTITSYFTVPIPTIVTTESEIIIYYTMAGPRQIRVYNEVNQKDNVDSVQEVIDGVASSFSSPNTFWWNSGTTHQLQTPKLFLDETNGKNKYKNWQDKFDVVQTEIAPRRFQLTVSQDAKFKAKFDQAQRIQLSNVLVDASASGGTVTYEYSPGLTTTGVNFDDYDYKDLSNGHPINTNVPNGTLGLNWSFLGWSDGNLNQSRNLIVDTDKNLIGSYKAHLRSTSSSALTGNSQRKTIKDYAGWYHAVYEAAGRIYYIKKSPNGVDWSGETLLSYNSNNYRNPSIGVYQGSDSIWYPAVTWEYFEPGIDWFAVEYRKASSGGWESMETVSGYTLEETTIHGKPNIVYPFAFFQHTDGLYWCYRVNNGWSPEINKIPNTTADSRNISVIHGTGQDNLIHIAWEEAGSIYYRNASISGDALNWSGAELVASGSEMVDNTSPSIALDNAGKVTIAWQYFHNELIDGSKINIRKRLGTNSYGSVTAYGQYRKQNLAPSISGSRKSNNNLSVVWHSSTNTIKRVSYSNNTWGAMYDMASNGVDAQIYLDEAHGYSTTKSALYRGTTGTYYPIGAVAFTEPSGLEKLGRNSNIVASRSLVLSSDQGEHRIEIGEPTVYTSETASMIVPFLEVGDTIPVGSLESAMPFFRTEPFLLVKGAAMVLPVDFRASRSSDDSRLSELRCVVDLIETGTGKLLASIPLVQRTDGGKQVITPKFGGDVRVEAQVRVLSGPENARCHIENITSSLDSASIEQLQKEGEKLVVNVKPTTYELSQNYPNPFNPVTTIHYALPKAGTVMLKVYDITGKEVATLVDGYHDIGRYTVPFDGSGLASGLYIYKITSGSFTQIKKMMLVK